MTICRHGFCKYICFIVRGILDTFRAQLDCDFRHQPRLADNLHMLSQAWRTKRASIQMLGAMAFCSPQQLASCLPQIIPYLVDAFTDTHQKVLKGTDDKSKRALIPNSSHANP